MFRKRIILLMFLFSGLVYSADLYMAGDSTMQTYNEKAYPQEGWGQRMQALVKDGVTVHNKSIGGRSTKSFKDGKRWERLVAEVKKGDFVIIQFGHNDGSYKNPKRYTKPEEYKENLRGFIADIQTKEATPVLVTSIPFGSFNNEGKVNPAKTLGTYIKAMREIAAETKCDLIDLNEYAIRKFNEMGEEKVTPMYLVFGPGVFDNYPDGKKDRCHISDKGAVFYAEAVATIAKEKQLPIAEIFK